MFCSLGDCINSLQASVREEGIAPSGACSVASLAWGDLKPREQTQLLLLILSLRDSAIDSPIVQFISLCQAMPDLS